MGRKLDALLGRKFKTSKLEATLNLAISRLSLLKNHRSARFTIALSDLVQLLRLNHHQQALLRVEQVMKDENMLEVYDMINCYCHLLKRKIGLIEKSKYAPF
ncbi:putative vacuolar protein sorting-associated protein Ist1 [Helianthus annuus]|nr:putative vacuolar protein sorting-associated protein Ist1 [Helianthus annuus]